MSLTLLDRDRVINDESPDYIKRPSELRPNPGSMGTIARLNRAGRTVVLCANQSGVVRALLTKESLDSIHDAMRASLAAASGHLDGILCCIHAPEDHCAYRKPAPALLIRAMSGMEVSPNQTAFIDDSPRDMQAAIAARGTPMLVRTGHGGKRESSVRGVGVDRTFDDLAAATDWLLDQ